MKRIYERVIQRIRRVLRIVRIGATSRTPPFQFVNVASTFWAGHGGLSPVLFYGDPKLAPKVLGERVLDTNRNTALWAAYLAHAIKIACAQCCRECDRMARLDRHEIQKTLRNTQL